MLDLYLLSGKDEKARALWNGGDCRQGNRYDSFYRAIFEGSLAQQVFELLKSIRSFGVEEEMTWLLLVKKLEAVAPRTCDMFKAAFSFAAIPINHSSIDKTVLREIELSFLQESKDYQTLIAVTKSSDDPDTCFIRFDAIRQLYAQRKASISAAEGGFFVEAFSAIDSAIVGRPDRSEYLDARNAFLIELLASESKHELIEFFNHLSSIGSVEDWHHMTFELVNGSADSVKACHALSILSYLDMAQRPKYIEILKALEHEMAGQVLEAYNLIGTEARNTPMNERLLAKAEQMLDEGSVPEEQRKDYLDMVLAKHERVDLMRQRIEMAKTEVDDAKVKELYKKLYALEPSVALADEMAKYLLSQIPADRQFALSYEIAILFLPEDFEFQMALIENILPTFYGRCFRELSNVIHLREMNLTKVILSCFDRLLIFSGYSAASAILPQHAERISSALRLLVEKMQGENSIEKYSFLAGAALRYDLFPMYQSVILLAKEHFSGESILLADRVSFWSSVDQLLNNIRFVDNKYHLARLEYAEALLLAGEFQKGLSYINICINIDVRAPEPRTHRFLSYKLTFLERLDKKPPLLNACKYLVSSNFASRDKTGALYRKALRLRDEVKAYKKDSKDAFYDESLVFVDSDFTTNWGGYFYRQKQYKHNHPIKSFFGIGSP